MPDTKVKYTRGGSNGVDAEPLVDGQLLFDQSIGRILMDTPIDDELTRIQIKEGIFTGSSSEWEALTDEEKEKYTFVNITDDFESHSDVFKGATATTDGQAGLVTRPLAGDQDSYLKGDGSWSAVSLPDDMVGATSSSDGNHGLVPTPLAGDEDKVLKGDGSWGDATPFEFGIESDAYGYYKADGTFTAFKSQADIDSAVAAAKVGTATESDVLIGKTFTNSTTSGLNGGMKNNGAVSATLNTSTTSYTVPAGYHNGSGKVSITTQTKSATPSTSAQTISPDSGKLLSSVSVAAISPVRTSSTLNQVTASGIDSKAPYVYFPYGWWPSTHATYGAYVYMTAAQAQALHAHTGTYTFPANDTGGTKDLGTTHGYRYVNATNVYNKGKADGTATTVSGGMVTSGSKSFTVPAGTYYFMACAADSNAYAYRTQARVTVNGSDVVFAEGAGEHCSSRDSTATRTFTSATTITCTVTRTTWNLPGAAGFYKT